MIKWLNSIFRGQLQEQGFTRTGAGIVAPPDLFQTNYADSGVVVNKEACFGLPAFKRGVEIVANRVGYCKCHVLETLDDGGREYAKDHPAWRVVRKKASPNLSPADVFTQLISDALWNGNGYAWIQPGTLNLYCLSPENTTPVVVHGPTTQELYFVVEHGEGKTALDASEVIHVKGLGQSCGLVGMRLLDYARENIGLGVATQTYASTYFRMGGLSDVWVEAPEGSYMDEDQQRQMLTALKRLFAGVNNSHSPIVLTGGAKLNKTVLSDHQLLSARQFGLVDVANLIGIDPSFLGGATNTSYKSLTEIGTAALANSFNPWLSRLESQLSAKLLREDEQERFYIEFDRSDLTKGDATAEAALAVQRLHGGLMSWEEYRKSANLPIDNKEKETFWRPANLVDAFAEPPAPAPAFGSSMPQAEPPKDEPVEERGKQITRAALDRLCIRLRKDAPAGTDALISRHRQAFNEALPGCNEWVDTFLNSLGTELDNVLPEQRSRVLAELDTEQLLGGLWNMN